MERLFGESLESEDARSSAEVQIAQAITAQPQVQPPLKPDLTLVRPLPNEAIDHAAGAFARISFLEIRSEQIVLSQDGGNLVIRFTNGGSITLADFFGSTGEARDDLQVIVEGDVAIDGVQFASIFPIAADPDVLPAAGESDGNTNGRLQPNDSPDLGALGNGLSFQDLLGDTELTGQQFADTLRVLDTLPEAIGGGVFSGTITEEALGNGPVSISGGVPIDFGAGGFGSVFFTGAVSIAGSPALNLVAGNAPVVSGMTAGGVPVLVGLSADGQTITGTAGGNPVFTITLNGGVNSTFTFTLLDAIDHLNAQDVLQLVRFAVQGTDGDGDTLNNPVFLDISILDDVPELNGPAESGLVDEDDLGNGTDGSEPRTVTGSLNIDWGQDDDNTPDAGGIDRTVRFDGIVTGDPVVSANGQALTSNGQALTWTMVSDSEIVAESATGIAIRVTLSDLGDGSYTFELLDNIDHLGADAEALALALNFIARDADGDEIGGIFSVTVVDDAPVAGPSETRTLNEGALPDGNEAGQTALVATGSLGVDFGADDGSRNFAFGTRSVLGFPVPDVRVYDSAGNEIVPTSNGNPLTYTVTTNGAGNPVLTAQTLPIDGNPSHTVFTIELDEATGNYIFTLNDNLDHYTGNGQTLDVRFAFTATDSDGDSVTSNATVRIEDDTPVANGPQPGSLREEDLPGVPNLTDPTAADVRQVSGSVGISWGADNDTRAPGQRSLSFTGSLTAPDLVVTDANGDPVVLRSDGQQVLFVVNNLGDGAEITGYVPGLLGVLNPANHVFRITLDPDAAAGGQYTFTLLRELNHTLAGEDALSLAFQVRATDSDGDSVLTTVTVEVYDDMPVVVAPAGVTVDEDGLSGGNPGGGATDAPGEDTTVNGTLTYAFGADGRAGTASDLVVATAPLTALGLTSNGVVLTYAFNAATNTLTASADGAPVFTFQVTNVATGAYSFKLLRPLDHAPGQDENDIVLPIVFTIQDGDGDTATGTLNVTVDDDTPVALGTAVDTFVSEAPLPSIDNPGGQSQVSVGDLRIDWGADNGSNRHIEFARDINNNPTGPALKSDGVTLVYKIEPSADGNEILIAYKQGDATETPVFVVDLREAGTGYYSFGLFGNLDHPAGNGAAGMNLNFTVTAYDSDGDPLVRTFTVSVADDVPVAGNAVATLREDALGDGSAANPPVTAAGSLNVAWGADDGDARSVTFTQAQMPQGLESEGQQVRYIITAQPDGSSSVLAFIGGPLGFLLPINHVFSLTLSDAGFGSYTFQLYKNIDHPGAGGDTLGLTFGYTATDGDGDTAAGTIRIDVVDDVVSIGAPQLTSVDEDDLPRGNDTLPREPLTVSGGLAVTWGADDNLFERSLSFTGSDMPAGLTSGGQTVLYSIVTSLDGNSYAVGYVPGFLGAANPANWVFTVDLDDNGSGSYTFSLLRQLDHAPGSDSLDLNFGFTATDGDGDTAHSTFTVRVADDLPIVNPSQTGVTVDEDGGLAGGNPGGAGDINAGVTATGALSYSFGADGAAGEANNITVDTAALDARNLTSSDVPLSYSWNAATNTLTATAGAVTVFTFQVTNVATGAYRFTLLDAIDHAGPDEDNLLLPIGFTIQDFDGDTASGSVTITINDDTAVVSGGERDFTLDEDDLANGNNAAPSGQHDQTVLAGKSLGVQWGADDGSTRDLAFTNAEGPTGFKADGQTVIYDVSADGRTLTAHTGDIGNPVFTVTLDPSAANGAYTFTLFRALDHLDGAAPTETLALNFTFDAIDSDGDHTPSSFVIRVTDDVPVATGAVVSGTVHEEDILTFGSVGSSPNFGPATLSGTLISTVSFGADGQAAQAFTFAANATAQLSALGLESKGLALSYSISGGDTIVARAGGRLVFEFEIDRATGAYEFRLHDQLDHLGINADTIVLDLGAILNATDGDGDAIGLGGKLLVTVRDDVPDPRIALTGATVTHDETPGQNGAPANDSGGLTAALLALAFNGIADKGNDPDVPGSGAIGYARSGAPVVVYGLDLSPGADEPFAVSLGLAITDAVSGLFTTAGDAITLTLEGGFIVGRVVAGPLAGQAAFAVGIDGLGVVSVAQYLSLQHAAGDPNDLVTLAGKIAAVVSATDNDGDTVTRSVDIGGQVRFADDGPTASYSDGVTVTENADANGDFITTAASGQLIFSGGADGASVTGVTYRFGGEVLDPDAGGWAPVALESNGVPVTIVTTTVSGVITLTGTANGAPVFTLVIQPDGTYTYTAQGPIDHPGLNQGGAADPLRMVFDFTVTDGDGDTATEAFQVDILDDVPVAPAQVRVSLDDDALPGGNPGGVGDGTDAANTSGTLAIDFGADGGTVAWVAPTLATGGYSYQIDGSVLDIFQLQSGVTVKVLTATLDPVTGAYAVAQLAAVKHPTAANENEVPFNLNYRVTDSDGDSAAGIIRVVVDDDTPTATGTVTATVDEAGLAHAGNPGGIAQGVGGDLGISWGADSNFDLRSIGFVRDGGGNPTGPELASDGVPLEYAITNNAGGNEILIAYKQGDAAQTPVFSLELGKFGGGYFGFALFGNIDHPVGNGTAPISLIFTAIAKDADGDAIARDFTIDIIDDVPSIAGNPTPVNLLTNGDFADGPFTPAGWGPGGGYATQDIGWTIEGTEPGQTGVQVERVGSGFSGMTASGGASMIDMGITPGNLKLSQTVNGLAAGESYQLSFEMGTPGTGALEVRWNGQLLVIPAITGAMALVTLTVTAQAGGNTIEFKEVGAANDNIGTYLANIALTEIGAGVPAHADAMGEDEIKVITLVEGSDFDFGADGAGTVAIDAAAATIAGPAGLVLALPGLAYDNVTHSLTVTPHGAFDALSAGEIATLTVPYTITDRDGDTVSGVFQITVTGTNDAPVIAAIPPVSIAEDSTVTVTQGELQAFLNLLVSDADQTNTELSYTFTVDGSVVANFPGSAIPASITFTPPPNFNGLLNASLSVTDGAATTVRDFTITVTPVNDAPILSASLSGATYTDTAADDSFTAVTGLLTSTDVDAGDTAAYGLIGGLSEVNTVAGIAYDVKSVGAYGTLFVNSVTGAYTYVPDDAAMEALLASASESFTFTVTDAAGATDTESFTVTLNGTNDTPVVASANHSVSEDGALTGMSVIGSDVDTPAANLTYSVFGASPEGLVFNADGTWSYTPPASFQPLNAGETTSVSFLARAHDGTTFSAPATIAIEIVGADDVSPITVNDLAPGKFYAFADPADGPGTINFDASELFSGGQGPLTYTVNQVHHTSSDGDWLGQSGGVFSGNPDQGPWLFGYHWSDAGLYIHKVTATDAAGATASTYVAFSAIEADGATVNVFNNSPANRGSANSADSDLILITSNGVNGEVNAGGGHDVMIGYNTNADHLNGGNGDDALYGLGGADRLFGGAGNDFLNGGMGDDVLNGGAGRDVLVGGGGADTFMFDALLSDPDIVADYGFGEGDRLDLSALLESAFGALPLPEWADPANFARLQTDATGSMLQVDITGPAFGGNWVDIAFLDGVGAGDSVKVILDNTHANGTATLLA